MQLVPPNSHRRNMGERTIRTWKGHFISVLLYNQQYLPILSVQLSCAPGRNVLKHSAHIPCKPAHLGLDATSWCVRFSCASDRPSWHARRRLRKPEVWETCGPHALDGFYIDPAREHYRRYNVRLPATNRVRVSDALAWFQETTPMPGLSPIDLLSMAIKDLSILLSSLSN
jgi:hypothetical protein